MLKKKLDATTTKAKLKFDRQIVSIAKARRVDRIYTGDGGLGDCAIENGIPATMTWEIPEPPIDPQQNLFISK